MIKNVWKNYLKKRGGIANDQYIIMPNHMHGIIFIVGAPLVGALSVDPRMVGKDRAGTSNYRAGTRPAPTKSLGGNIGIFKSISTHQYAINVNVNNWMAFPGKLWQRNYTDKQYFINKD